MRKNLLFLITVLLSIGLAVSSIYLYSQILVIQSDSEKVIRENITLTDEIESLNNKLIEQEESGPKIVDSLEHAYFVFSNYLYLESNGKKNIKDYPQTTNDKGIAVYDNSNGTVFYRVSDQIEAKGYYEVSVVQREKHAGDTDTIYYVYPNAFVSKQTN